MLRHRDFWKPLKSSIWGLKYPVPDYIRRTPDFRYFADGKKCALIADLGESSNHEARLANWLYARARTMDAKCGIKLCDSGLRYSSREQQDF